MSFEDTVQFYRQGQTDYIYYVRMETDSEVVALNEKKIWTTDVQNLISILKDVYYSMNDSDVAQQLLGNLAVHSQFSIFVALV
jgi:hypothetical protein